MRCFGYTKTGDPEPDEARAVADAFDRVAAGQSLRSVVADWDNRGVRTSTGRRWQGSSLRRLLRNPHLAGRGKRPAIVAADLFDRVNTMLAEPSRRSSAPPGRRYLLTGGLSRCGRCGTPLQAQPSTAGRRGYVCRADPGTGGCGRIRIAAAGLEEHVTVAALARLASPHARHQIAPRPDDVDNAPARISDCEERLVELGSDYADRLVGRLEFLAARDRLHARIVSLRRLQDDAQTIAGLPDPDSLAAWWEAAPLVRRHELLRLVLDHVEVDPATRPSGFSGFDEGRVRILWR